MIQNQHLISKSQLDFLRRLCKNIVHLDQSINFLLVTDQHKLTSKYGCLKNLFSLLMLNKKIHHIQLIHEKKD